MLRRMEKVLYLQTISNSFPSNPQDPCMPKIMPIRLYPPPKENNVDSIPVDQ